MNRRAVLTAVVAVACAVAALAGSSAVFAAGTPPVGSTGVSGSTSSTGTTGTTSATGPTGSTAPAPLVYRTLHYGERGPLVRLLQKELAAKRYVVGKFGVYDARTGRAVLAFRKMTGMERNHIASPAVFRKLAAGEGAFKVRYPGQGRHVEGDLTHQVLALIGANGKVQRLYPMSSGKPSTPTQLGTYQVYMQEYGTNNDGMVNSSFFNGGDAIHGYAEVPPYAASHGCLRVPIPDSLSIRHWVRIGTTVDVYYRR
jgi:peptidoglycan hydrolase-like protein with peptidoglycan-binding domain